MNLLAIIVVFLAIVVCVAIAWIAWEVTPDDPRPDGADRDDSSER